MMNKQAFDQLYQRYLQGKCTAEEIRLIDQWFENIESDPSLSLTDREEEALEEALLERILQQTGQPVQGMLKNPFHDHRRNLSFYSRIAASVLLVLTLAWVGWSAYQSNLPVRSLMVFGRGTDLLSHCNTKALAETILLEDGSQVILSPGGRISYPRHFSPDKREIVLQGNAFFEVVRNPGKPFFVYSGQLITQVLGTSFWVKTQAHSKAIEVEVKTGRVSVYENQDPTGQLPFKGKKNSSPGIVLTPNQKATFFAEDTHLVAGLVDNPVVVNAPQSPARLVYEETPLPQVLKDLEKIYAIELVMANDQMKTCTILGDLTGMSLRQQLDLICQAINASYEVKGLRIVISGDGCE